MNPFNAPHRALQMPEQARNRWIDTVPPNEIKPRFVQAPVDKRKPIDGWLVSLAVCVVIMAAISVWVGVKIVQVLA